MYSYTPDQGPAPFLVIPVMKRILFISLLLVLLKGTSNAQQDAQFSQYMFNGLYLNPAYAGIEGLTRFTLIHRTQWLGYQPTESDGTAPTSQMFSASSKLPENLGGAGLYFLLDQLGPIRNIDLQLSYSYHLKVGEGTLGIGLRGGIYSQRASGDFYRVVHPDDPIYSYFRENGNVSQTKTDVTGGVWYQKKKYYAGISFTHLPRSKFTMGYDKISSRLVNHMYITGGYHFETGGPLQITPSVLVQTDLNELTYLLGPTVTYSGKISAGIHVRQSFAQREASQKGKTLSNDDIILYAGIHMLKDRQGNDALKLGYAFDFVTSGVNAKKRTSHEVMISYRIIPLNRTRPKVKTPRYTFDQ